MRFRKQHSVMPMCDLSNVCTCSMVGVSAPSGRWNHSRGILRSFRRSVALKHWRWLVFQTLVEQERVIQKDDDDIDNDDDNDDNVQSYSYRLSGAQFVLGRRRFLPSYFVLVKFAVSSSAFRCSKRTELKS